MFQIQVWQVSKTELNTQASLVKVGQIVVYIKYLFLYMKQVSLYTITKLARLVRLASSYLKTRQTNQTCKMPQN